MSVTEVYTWAGIFASFATIITGGFLIYEYIKKRIKEREEEERRRREEEQKRKIEDQLANKKGDKRVEDKPGPVPPPVNGIWEFNADEAAYRNWLKQHPSGFVINTDTQPKPGYMVLHKAACSHIGNFQSRNPGAFTERGFMKVCADDVQKLRAWVKQHGRPDGTFSSECGQCKPLQK